MNNFQGPVAGRDVIESFVEIDGVRTRVLEVEGEGPAILLLHGFSDSADSFRPLLAELAGLSRRAVAVDMPGSGRAASLGRPAMAALDSFADGFVRRYAGDDGAVLVGNSLGGLVAFRAAARPDLPLVSVAGLGPAGLAYHQRLEALTRWLSWLDPILRLIDRFPLPGPIIRRATQAMYDRRLARGRADASLGFLYASHIRGMRDVGRLRRDLIDLTAQESILDTETLASIAVPVLLIWGDSDRLADVNGAQVLLEAVRHSRLVVLDDCGHCPQVEVPDEIARLLVGLPTTFDTNQGPR